MNDSLIQHPLGHILAVWPESSRQAAGRHLHQAPVVDKRIDERRLLQQPLISFCRGMSAFLTGDFEEALSGLWRWCEGGIDSSLKACSSQARLRSLKLAIAAVKSIEHQAKDTGADELSARARGILDELELTSH